MSTSRTRTFVRCLDTALTYALSQMDIYAKLDHVNEQLARTLTSIASGVIAPNDVFGAIAPPAMKVASRWNLLLDMDPETRTTLEMALSHSSDIFDHCCGSEAILCDLSALIADPGCSNQQLHYDTRFSDDECESDEDAEPHQRERCRRHQQKRLVTAFVALQDVTMEMGPSLIVPQTTSQATHNTVADSQHEEGLEFLEEIATKGMHSTLLKGDMMLMDSRALHRGTGNVSAIRRVLLDFAFMARGMEPSTYCGCIKPAVGDSEFLLESFRSQPFY